MSRSAATVSSCVERRARTTPTTLVVRLAMMGSAAAALLSGLALWPVHATVVHRLHGTLGMVVLAGLVVSAVLGGRAGAPRRLLGAAVALDVLAAAIGSGQQLLLPGPWHWTIRVLHLATMAAAMMVAGRLLDRVEAASRGQIEAASREPIEAASRGHR